MWHFTAAGKQGGPVQFDELVRLANLGVIDRMRDKVWCEGMANWTPIMQIDGIYTSPPPLIAGPPPSYVSGPRVIRKTNFALFATMAIVGSVLANIGSVCYLIGTFDYDSDVMMTGLVFTFLAMPFSITMTVLGAMYVYRMWLIIQEPGVRTTPGKAVGFLFIPFFNLYWMFVAFWLWAKDYKQYTISQQGSPQVKEGLFLTLPIICCASVLGFIPFVGSVIGLAWLVVGLMVFSQICRVINHFAQTGNTQPES